MGECAGGVWEGADGFSGEGGVESWVDEGLETRENALCWTDVDAMMGLYNMYIAKKRSMSSLASCIHSLPSRSSETTRSMRVKSHW